MRLALTCGNLGNPLPMLPDLCLVPCHDDFSFGPLPLDADLADFIDQREAFWGEPYGHLLDGQSHAEMMQAVRAAEEVEIWISDTVQEVCHALATLHLLRLGGIAAERIALRLFGPCGGLMLVSPAKFAARFGESRTAPVDPDLCAAAFAALAAGGPAIRDWMERHPEGPFSAAFSVLLLRFPAFNGGLGALDRALLAAVSLEMRSSAYTIGGAMGLGFEGIDHVGDFILFRRLLELAAAADPWFELEGDPTEMRRLRARLSPAGAMARRAFGVQPFQP